LFSVWGGGGEEYAMPPLAASNHAKEVEETLDRYPVGVPG